MKTFRYCLLVFAALVSLMNFPGAQEPKERLRVLFIGNSFTFTNDLPAILEALAKASQQKRLIYQAIVFPNFGLKEQWQRGDAQKAIVNGRWDIVVLQQGPSGLEESRRLLIEYTRLFDKEIRASGAKTALYMVWPSEVRFGDFDRVIESYKLAADDVKAILFPVGQAWREAWRLDGNIALYSEDKFHPSVAGSYLAGLVIYEKLFGKSPLGLPANLKLRSKSIEKIELPQGQAKLLQIAATEANKKF